MQRLKLDDFQLENLLGRGTAGEIFSAIQKETRKKVAIKRIHVTVGKDPLIEARFRREMLILERLRHPHIVEYYGGGEDDEGHLFYVMELIDGGTIRDLLERSGALPWQSVVTCGKQVCSALQCSHNHGIIHRDLKPSNLFLTRDGIVKLGDFGIARDIRASELTAIGLTVGTHAYMAPEQITGKTNITGKTDLYSLGCCFYEMLTNQKPFSADNFPQLFEQHLKAEPPKASHVVPECPPELDVLIVELLAKDPEARPFNARSVQGRLFEIARQYFPTAPTRAPEAETGVRDVAAHEVEDIGLSLLKTRLHARFATPPEETASWRKVLLLAAIAVIVILFGYLLS